MSIINAYGICLYKKENNTIKVLLGKSFFNNKWGFLKGAEEINENKYETAQREFFEECGIFVETKYFEDYFYQKNNKKNIGIFCVNSKNVPRLDRYFSHDRLKDLYQTCENEDVQFFDIKDLPDIKSKQQKIVKEIIALLKTN